MEVLIIIVLAIVGLLIYQAHATKMRREFLMSKYGDAVIVDRLMSRSFWQGQTADQLRDSLGTPLDVDTRVMKTKTKEVWKYNQQGKNRYNLKITLEESIVIGWDQK